MLDKTFSPADVEARQYARTEASGRFAADPRSNARPYTIMMPPPNVTGSLHMGHALSFTLQDVLIRYQRARGNDALWQPGTDHAGIATQMVVERQLAAQGIQRADLGRDAFVERVWQWKAESGGTITNQLRRLGASADWARERFTLDEGLNRAVTKVFVDLYEQGLIYRDKRLVNWDPKLHTAVSDLEVESREEPGTLWHLVYPVEGGGTITVATSRPETMLGDTAVAVHPDDERYRDLIGRHAVLPLVGRRIPIVADTYSDPEKGTGAVKITPAHDFNDFEVGRRHGLERINIFDADARLNDAVPEPYRGLDRFDGRARVLADLEALGLVAKVEKIVHAVPYADRSGVIIEPWLTDQWYCDAKTLAIEPIRAVETGRTQFVPKQWEATFFEWMRNIQPWCISRQIWWGHQIPAWYGPDGTVFVASDAQAAQAKADAHHGRPVELVRDPDVLDTWFSSALWPFSTLGWPDRTQELERYYPTDVLVTGFDIIFFWVARMMMMGCHFMGDVPFRTVYIHALVRDARGQKMSKSKGNIIDPLDLIDKYGADALRFTMAALAAPGRDVKMDERRVEGYRNFATKLWNATRYAQMNGCALVPGFDPAKVGLTVNRWIVGALVQAERRLAAALDGYRFNEAAAAIYQFAWNSVCDWYLEFTKPILTGEPGPDLDETRATTAWVLSQILQLLNPLMPFLTEELAQQTGAPGQLIEAAWPRYPDGLIDPAADAEMDWVIRLVAAIRSLRSELNVPSGALLPLHVLEPDPRTRGYLDRHGPAIRRLARLETIGQGRLDGAVSLVQDGITFQLGVAGSIDVAAERKRLAKEIERQDREVAKLDAKLANADFLAKADEAVIEDTRERRDEAAAARTRLAQALEQLAGA